MTSRAAAGFVLLVLSTGALALAFRLKPTASPPQATTLVAAPIATPVRAPSLYCDFYDFMHAAVVVSFDFKLALAPDGPPQFSERFEARQDGTETTFDEAERPAWTYALDDGAPTIASPDGATRILLYGFEPHRGGVFWTEAGIRSTQYRNLEGKCRQANLGGDAAGTPPAKGDQTP